MQLDKIKYIFARICLIISWLLGNSKLEYLLRNCQLVIYVKKLNLFILFPIIDDRNIFCSNIQIYSIEYNCLNFYNVENIVSTLFLSREIIKHMFLWDIIL